MSLGRNPKYLTAPAPDPTWAERGSCHVQNLDTNLFFPLPHETTKRQEAIYVCDDCPVQQECLNHAMENNEHGIWGGTTERQRVNLRRTLKRVPPKKKPRPRPAGRAPVCECGCGAEVKWNLQTGKWYRYAGWGHHRRNTKGKNQNTTKPKPLYPTLGIWPPTSVTNELLPFCECGCGNRVKRITNGVPSRWIQGHHLRRPQRSSSA
jgi:WhiB family redox-sensing transcriptional regulator